MNLLCSEEGSEAALHFNPRLDESVVVFNTKEGGAWGREERGRGCPFQRGQPFEVLLIPTQDGFKVCLCHTGGRQDPGHSCGCGRPAGPLVEVGSKGVAKAGRVVPSPLPSVGHAAPLVSGARTKGAKVKCPESGRPSREAWPRLPPRTLLRVHSRLRSGSEAGTRMRGETRPRNKRQPRWSLQTLHHPAVRHFKSMRPEGGGQGRKWSWS